ncbi:ABC transporter permease subunit [Spirillospora sp. NPDC049652]
MTPRRLGLGAVGIACALLAWEAVSRTGLVDDSSLPPASTVLGKAADLAGDGDWTTGLGATVRAWAGGLLLATAVAVPIGVVLGTVRFLGTAARALVELCRPVPSVALIPLATILFSSVTQAETSLVFYASLWPILINTLYALRDVDPVAKESLRAFGFRTPSVLLRVALPSAAPFIATGVRIAASVGLIVVVSAELTAGGGDGIGVYLMQSQSGGGNTDVMLAGALWAGALGLLANAGLLRLERLAFRWHSARTEGVS